jgi:hypothetical protein
MFGFVVSKTLYLYNMYSIIIFILVDVSQNLFASSELNRLCHYVKLIRFVWNSRVCKIVIIFFLSIANYKTFCPKTGPSVNIDININNIKNMLK